MKKVIVVALLAVLAAGQPAAQAELPDTGQGFCREKDSTPSEPEPSCDNTECPGQDGSFQADCPPPGKARFVILPGPNGVVDPAVEDPEAFPRVPIPAVDDTVFDRCTGLEWQRSTADTTGDGFFIITPDTNMDGIEEPEDSRTWAAALTYCEDLEYAGHDDWRLPNVLELQSIVDYGRVGVTAVHSQDHTLIDDDFTFILAKYGFTSGDNKKAPHWASTCRPTCSVATGRRCFGTLFPENPDGLHVDGLDVTSVEFVGPGAGVMGLGPSQPGLNLFRAVRGGTITVPAGGGADGDGAERGGGAGPMCVADTYNGNVNGDGARDLSDAVYELAWLFQGGPIPEPFCVTPGPKAEGCAVENGNTNGDGARDLSDVVYLLAWLFQGGPEPVAPCPDLAAPEICDNMTDDDLDGDIDCADADCVLLPGCDIATDLPATGVTLCYHPVTGAEISCDGTGQDAAYQAGCVGSPRFEPQDGPDGEADMVGDMTPDDTVIDNCTGLEWTRWRLQGGPEGKIWCDMVEYCQNSVTGLNAGGGFAGKTGWRFPNVREAASLMLYGLPPPPTDRGTLIGPLFGVDPGIVSSSGTSTLRAQGAYGMLYNGGIGLGKPLDACTTLFAVRNADSP